MDHRNMKLSRRSLLQGLGSLAITSPLARVVSQAQAAADTGPLPRLLLISAECAGSTYWWRPQGTETNFTIDYPGSVLAPCADLKGKMLILNGVGNYVAARDLLGGIEGHECRSVTFTGMANSLPGEPNKARGPSIDQLIISQLGETRPLHASIGGYGGTGSEYYYNGLGNAIPGVYTPRGIFDALFADVPSSGAPTDASAVALRNYARALLTRQLADAQTLKGRVGSEGKAKLEEYLATIQDRIRALETVPTAQTALPARPTHDPN